MEAIVLVGGLGTRLAHIISDVPKPMASVCDRPFLEYIIKYILKMGASKIILAAGYKREVIEKYFGDKYEECILEYSVENMPLLTGGAIKQALVKCQEDNVVIINGDTYFNVDLKDMFEYHLLNNADITIATKRMFHFQRYGALTIEKNRIIAFQEKQPVEEGLINGGIYVIKKRLLEAVPAIKFSFEQDILGQDISKLNVMSYESKGYFIDIGIEEDYQKAQKDFREYEQSSFFR